MPDKQDAGDKHDLSKSTADDKYLPIDPSNTSQVGQKVETPIVSRDKGISEQSAKWEDVQERGIPSEPVLPAGAERYIKDPSPEDMQKEENEDKPD